MKQKYRNKAFNDLLDALEHKDFDRRENAMFQMAQLLDRSNSARDSMGVVDYYGENLPREVSRLRLSEQDQQQLVDHLTRVVVSYAESRATALWTMRKVRQDIMFVPLLALIQAVGKQLNNEAAYQVCSAMRNCLDPDSLSMSDQVEHLRLHDPLPILGRWQSSKDGRLRKNAEIASDLIKQVIDECSN